VSFRTNIRLYLIYPHLYLIKHRFYCSQSNFLYNCHHQKCRSCSNQKVYFIRRMQRKEKVEAINFGSYFGIFRCTWIRIQIWWYILKLAYISSILPMEATGSYEMLVTSCQPIRYHIPEGSDLHVHHYENYKSDVLFWFSEMHSNCLFSDWVDCRLDINSAVFWSAMLCIPIEVHWCIRGPYCDM
jgi:hypothetical protein